MGRATQLDIMSKGAFIDYMNNPRERGSVFARGGVACKAQFWVLYKKNTFINTKFGKI